MAGLCGWFDFEPAGSADPQVIARMGAAISRFDRSAVRSVGCDHGTVATAAAGGDADLYHDDGLVIAIWGRLRFTDEELAARAQRYGITRALAQGYAARGTKLLELLSGAFALAILDDRNGEALLAIDRMGMHPLCYALAGERLVFGSTLDAIRAFPSIGNQLNRQAIYDYVYFHMVPGPQTIHTGCHRLSPGSLLLWRNGKVESRCYWEMRYVENERRPLTQLKEGLLAVLREGVREAARDRIVGTFLSGGTDSSTVAGLLGQVTKEPARTYSIGFKAQGYDEMEYARIAARHFGARHHEYYVTPDDVVQVIPAIAAVHDQPFGNSSAVPTYYCAKLAKEDGIETLLGGDGGDELFGGNARYARQYLYSLYSDLPSTVRKRLIEPVAFALPEVNIIDKIQRYIRNASQAMPARYDNYNLLERFGAGNVFGADFLASVDPQRPQRLMATNYLQTSADTLINRMLALDLKYTLADNDLPKVMRSCELAGVAARFPMLDDTVVAFSARLAPELKLKGTQLRYFFKQALSNFLPPEVIAKQKHGFGLPFGPWLQTHKPLEQLALDSLADLKKRRIIRPDFIDELTSMHVSRHADYFGTMVWVLMMLEQWFREHRNAA